MRRSLGLDDEAADGLLVALVLFVMLRNLRAGFVAAAEALEIGATYDFGPELGSLISPEHRARVQAHVDDAVARGATVLTGGKARDDIGPAFFEPTVLAGQTLGQRLNEQSPYLIDQMVGGVGLRRGRRDPSTLVVAISASGNSPETVASTQLCLESGQICPVSCATP